MKIVDKDGNLLDLYIKEELVTAQRDGDRIVLWVHASISEVLAVQDLLLDGAPVPIFVPATRAGMVRLSKAPELIVISGSTIYLN